MRITDWLRLRFRQDTNGTTRISRPDLEALEPRLLLSADTSVTGAELPVNNAPETALIVDLQREAVRVEAKHTAPALPGLEFQGTDPTSVRGQIVYLDFEGERNVTYDGPAAVGPFDVPAFAVPGPLGGSEEVIEAQVCGSLRRLFATIGVVFTLERPKGDQPYSTIYIGGDDSAFAGYGSFEGLAEAVDIGNRNARDEALVFSEGLDPDATDLASYISRLVYVIAHETGHLLGYAHRAPATPTPAAHEGRGPLDSVAHATGPDDDQTAATDGPVHQWLTYNAFLFYNSQFAGSELAQYLGNWQDYGRLHHRTNGDNNDLIEGVFDEDVSQPIVPLFDNGFHWDIAPQNPLGQRIPYEQHFVAGADGDEIYTGWNGFASAVTQALRYWQPYVLATYSANAALAYYYLGHVAHLLEDVTVPAHVHNDAHPFRDAYEYTLGEHFNFLLWGYGQGARVAPANPIMTPADLVSLFRETIDYTEEYPSNNRDGEDVPEIPDVGLHRPDLVTRAGGFTGDGAILTASSSNEITTLADDLMPWAMEKVAELFRLFYSLVDTTAPVVNLVTFFGDDEASAVLKPDRFHIVAAAQDDLSGYEVDGFLWRIEKKNGSDWEHVVAGSNTSQFDFTAPGDGLYRVTVEVRDAAGNTGRSGTGYFRVEQAAGLTPVYRFWSPVTTRHFYTIRASERDKLINNYVGTWVYEGIAYYAFANTDQPGVAPIYRFWSGTLGSHLFTADAAEKTRKIDNDSATWTYEGIAFYVYPLGSPPAGTSGVYRFLSPTRVGHFYTMSLAERDKLRTLYPLVWTDEQLTWYAYEA